MYRRAYDDTAWMGLSEILFAAGEEGLRDLKAKFRRRRKGSFKTIRPGPYTPRWNQLRLALRLELRPYGSKVRLARYLGIHPQRITDFIAGHRRMPDAELTLQLLHWLAAKKAGKDLSI
jgi:hypothetical protein